MTNIEKPLDKKIHKFGEDFYRDIEFLLKRYWYEELSKDERQANKDGSMTLNPFVIIWVTSEYKKIVNQVPDQGYFAKTIEKILIERNIAYSADIFRSIINDRPFETLSSVIKNGDINPAEVKKNNPSKSADWGTFTSRSHPDNKKTDE